MAACEVHTTAATSCRCRWADPGTVGIEQKGCAKLTVSLSAPAPSGSTAPYLTYELPMEELAAHGRLAWDARALTFEGTGSWEGWQLPLGVSRRRESWSLARDETGHLRYTFTSRETSAVFWVIPARRTLHPRLPPAAGLTTRGAREELHRHRGGAPGALEQTCRTG